MQPGVQPTCRQRCFPRMGWRYLTTAIAVVDTIILIIELIVGSTMYGCAFAPDNQMGQFIMEIMYSFEYFTHHPCHSLKKTIAERNSQTNNNKSKLSFILF